MASKKTLEPKETSEEISEEGGRKEQKIMKDMKIITAISMGQDRNKDIAKVLDTDKSFASKKIKDLEDRGLIFREGEGKETRYKVNPSAVMRFLQAKVVIKWKKPVEHSTAESGSIPDLAKKRALNGEKDG